MKTYSEVRRSLESSLLKFRNSNMVNTNLPLKEFIKELILNYNIHMDTLYLNNKEQTERGRYRSLGDIYKLVRYYKGNVRLKDVRRLLLELCNENLVYTHWCNQINKKVFRFRTGNNNGFSRVSGNKIDEYGWGINPSNRKPNTNKLGIRMR